MNHIEQFGHGVTREWLDHDHIALITTCGDMSFAGVDAWAQAVSDTIRNFPAGCPVVLLQDMRSPSQGFSPYIRQRAEELYTLMAHSPQAYHALVLREGAVYTIISFFMRRRLQAPNVEEQLFTDREAALNWLRSKLVFHS